MQSVATLAKYTMASAVFLALFACNLFWWESEAFGLVLGIFFVGCYGWQFGAVLSPHEDRFARVSLGVSALLAALSIIGGGLYYLDALSETTIALVIMLSPLAIGVCRRFGRAHEVVTSTETSTKNKGSVITWLCLTILALAAISLLVTHPIATAVRSPWLVVPSIFFLLIFLIAWLIASRPNKWQLVLFFFLLVAVALIAYPLGYGFDGFIHRAAEQHIFDFGSISPKSLYYAGQYGLVLMLSRAFLVAPSLIDTLLVPVLAAVLIPLSAFVGFRKIVGHKHAPIASLAIFLIPLSSFITTTPQGLANIWTFLALFATLPIMAKKPGPRPYLIPILFTAAALVTHPLSGVPVALYLALIFVLTTENRARILRSPLAIIGSIALPLIFLLNAAIAHLPISIHFQARNLFEVFHLSLFFQNRFHPFLDAAYVWGWNRIIILIVMTIVGVVLVRRTRAMIPLIAAVMMLVNYFLLVTIVQFDFLIDYEQGNYAARIFEMAQFLLVPVLGIVLAKLWTVVETKPVALRAGFTTLIAMILTATMYLTYPRHDNYEISRGFNVSVSDYDAVHYIHDHHATIDYVVLANQAVSSAAMDAYGFAKYFPGDVFYYPIPTGGPLYHIYLEMVNLEPTHARATKAMDLAQVDTAYLVVNDYWFLSEKIIENAKREATTWTAIDDGATYVFMYTR